MKTKRGRICELAIVTAVLSLLLPISLPGSMAAQGDWFIQHNSEYVSKGGYCSRIATDGVNHIEGTFEWVSGNDPGITFQYTYDPSVAWYGVPKSWNSPHYVFDFHTDWDYYYSGIFIISVSAGSQYNYTCTTPT